MSRVLLRWVYAIPVGRPGQWPDDWRRTGYTLEFEAGNLKEFARRAAAAAKELLFKARYDPYRYPDDPEYGPDLLLDVWVPSTPPSSGPMRKGGKRWGIGNWGEVMGTSAGHADDFARSADQFWNRTAQVLEDPDKATAFFKD